MKKKSILRLISSLMTFLILVASIQLPATEVKAEGAALTAGQCSEYMKLIDSGYDFTLTLEPDGRVTACGDNEYGQCDVPYDLDNVVAVSAGAIHALALKPDGTVAAWGDNNQNQCNVPEGLNDVAAISAGGFHNLALKSDGTVVAWGENAFGECDVPEGLSGVTAISAGGFHSLALKSDGTLVAWGYSEDGETTIPDGLTDVAAISAPWNYSLALKSDGTVVGWGQNYGGQLEIPAGLGNVVAVSGSVTNAMALKSDGTVVTWGGSYTSEYDPSMFQPPTDLNGVVAITSQQRGSMALKADGTIVSWGQPYIAGCKLSDWDNYIDVYTNLGVYGDIDCSQPVSPESFQLVFNQNGGETENVTIKSIKKNDSTEESGASPITGGETTLRFFLDVTGTPTGEETIEIKPAGDQSIFEASGKSMSASYTTTYERNLNPLTVKISSAQLAEDNKYIDVTVTQAVYGDMGCTIPVSPWNFQLVFGRNGGNASNVSIKSIKKNDSIEEAEASSLTGRETTLRFFLDVSGTASGEETIEIKPADGQSVFMPPGIAMAAERTTGAVKLNADPLQLVSIQQAKNGYMLYIDVAFNRGIYGFVNITPQYTYTQPVTKYNFQLIFNQNSGNCSEASIYKITKNDSADSNTASQLTGGEKVLRFFIDTRNAPSGVETVEIKLTDGLSIYDSAGNAITSADLAIYAVQLINCFPQIVSAKMDTKNRYLDVNFSDGIYGANHSPISNSGFQFIFSKNGGSASNVSVKSIKQNNDVDEAKASPLTGGEKTLRFFLNVTGSPSGEETIEVKPAGGQAIFNFWQDPMAVGQTTKAVNLISQNPPSWSTDNGTETFGWMSDTMVSAGNQHTLVLGNDGKVVAWGGDVSYGQCSVPADLSGVKAVSAGGGNLGGPFSLALKRDGTVAGWGDISVSAGLSGVKAISAGGDNAYFLKYDGTVSAAGIFNHRGQLDVPSTLFSVNSISAGFEHVLALQSYGTVVAWGSNLYGECDVPAGLMDVKAVSAGGFYSLALKTDGTVVGWGNVHIPDGLNNVAAISAGVSSYLVLKSDGKALLYSTSGTLRNVPVNLEGISAVSAGWYHYAAIKDSGEVIVWKDDDFVDKGQLDMPQGLNIFQNKILGGTIAGDNSYIDINFDLPIYGPNGEPTPLKKEYLKAYLVEGSRSVYDVTISSLKKNDSTSETQASDLTGGEWTVRAFLNIKGIPSGTEAIEIKPASSFSVYSRSGNNFIKTQTTGLITLNKSASQAYSLYERKIDAGWNHSLAYKGAGTVFAWGDNTSGKASVPTGLTDAVQVSAGYNHSAALLYDGTVSVWGENYYHQLNVPYGLKNIAQVSAGGYHTLALSWAGTVAAWGDYYYGQCNVPVGLTGVKKVAAGGHHSLALKPDGTVAAWGDNYFGQCNVPAGLNNIISISAGDKHSLALKSDGTVAAWGDNSYGQCSVPNGLTDVKAVSAGYRHSLAIKADGTVVAWGDNSKGQCNVTPGLTEVIAVSAGTFYSIAQKQDGTVVAWGDNSSGQCNLPAGDMPPSITASSLENDNSYVDISFNTGVYGLSGGTGSISAACFILDFKSNSGTAGAVTIKSVKKTDNADESLASALTGGETAVRVFLQITGYPAGTETIEIKPSNTTVIYNSSSDAMPSNQTTGVLLLTKQDPPPAPIQDIEIDGVSEQLGAPYYDMSGLIGSGTYVYKKGRRTVFTTTDTYSTDWEHTLTHGANNNRIVLIALYSNDSNPYHQKVRGVYFAGKKMTYAASELNGEVKLDIYYALDADLPSDPGKYEITADYNFYNYYLEGHALSLINAAQQGPESTAANFSDNAYRTDMLDTLITTKTDGAMVVDIVGSHYNYQPACTYKDKARTLGETGCSGLSALIMDKAGTALTRWESNGFTRDWVDVAVAVRSAKYPPDPPVPETPEPTEPDIPLGDSIAFEPKNIGYSASAVQIGDKIAAVGNKEISFSDDGETWGQVYTHPEGNILQAGGKLFHFKFNDSTDAEPIDNNKIIVNSSSNGIDWTAANCTLPQATQPLYPEKLLEYEGFGNIRSVAADNNGTYIAVGNAWVAEYKTDGSVNMPFETYVEIWLTSQDGGVTWEANYIPQFWFNTDGTALSPLVPRTFEEVIYFRDKFVAFDSQSVYYSVDGSSWDVGMSFMRDSQGELTNPASHRINDILSRNNRLVMTCSKGDIYYSTDGVVWTSANIVYKDPKLYLYNSVTKQYYWNYTGFYSIAYTNNKFGASGYTCMAVSDDGMDWSLYAFDYAGSYLNTNLSAIRDNFYVVISKGLLSSSDLEDWKLENTGGIGGGSLFVGNKAYSGGSNGLYAGYQPLVTDTFAPVNDAFGVSVDAGFSISFTDSIKEGANFGGISLKNSSGSSVQISAAADGAGKLVSITPASQLLPATKYTLEIPEGALKDTLDTKVNKLISISFTTEGEPGAPDVIGSNPANNAAGVSSGSPFTIDFSEDIEAGQVYEYIRITPSGDPASPVAINKQISGSQLVLTPVKPLTKGRTYKVTIPSGSVKNLSGKLLAYDWSIAFTVELDDIAPIVESTDPADFGERISSWPCIKAVFSEEVQKGDGFNNITLQNIRGDYVRDILPTLSTTLVGDVLKSTLSINVFTPLVLHNTYRVTVPSDAVKDMTGNNMAASYSFTFTEEIANSAPVILETDPGDNEENVDVRGGITVLYDRKADKGSNFSAGASNQVILYDAVSHNQVDTDVSIGSQKDGNKLYITPKNDLDYETEYVLHIPANAISDLSGYEDSSSHDITFKTEKQSVASVIPAFGSAGAYLNSCVAVKFKQSVSKGCMFNNVTLKKAGITVPSRLMLDGDTILISPSENMDANAAYTVEVPRGAVFDAGLNKNNYYTVSFTTGLNSKAVNDYAVSSGMQIGEALVEGDQVSFDASGCMEDAVSYFWDFGDGESAAGVSVSHVFGYRGNYSVYLIVTGADGKKYTSHKVLNILEKPDPASISLEALPQAPVSLNAGGTADFTISLKCGDKVIRNASISVSRVYAAALNKQPEPLASVTTDYNGSATYRAALPEGTDEYFIAIEYSGREIRRLLKSAVGVVEITGYVRDDRNKVQKNASVIVGAKSTTTDANGFYRLTGLNVGTYNMRVSSDVHIDDVSSVTLTQKSTVRNITLTKIISSEKPVIRKVYTRYTDSSSGNNFYFLNGIDVNADIKVLVDWKGNDPGYIEFNKGGIIYNEADLQLSLNAGRDLKPGEELIVTCVSEDGIRSEAVNSRIYATTALPQEFPFELNPTFVDGKYVFDRYMNITGINTPDISDIPIVNGSPVAFLGEPAHLVGVMKLDGSFYAFIGKGAGISAYGAYYQNTLLQNYFAKKNVTSEAEKAEIASRQSKSYIGSVDIGGCMDASFYWYYNPSTKAWDYHHGMLHLNIDGNAYGRASYGIPSTPLSVYISGEFKVLLDTYLYAVSSNGNISFNGGMLDLKDLYIKIAGGVDAYVASGEVYLIGDGKVKVEFPSQKTDYYIQVKGGAKASALYWSVDFPFLEYEWGDKSPWTSSSSGIKSFSINSQLASKNSSSPESASSDIIPADTGEFKAMSRDYLKSQSSWQPGTNVNEEAAYLSQDSNKMFKAAGSSLTSASESDTSFKAEASDTIAGTALRNNSFPNTDHNVIPYNDGAFMVLVEDDPSRSDMNRTRVEYSVYDGSSWSAPQPIDPDDSTGDFKPVAAKTANGVIAAWENLKDVMPANAELRDAIAKEEISVARFNPETNSWSDIYNLTSDNYLDYSPRIAAGDSSGILVWIKNKSNDYSDILADTYSPSNDIMFSKWSGSTFGAPTVIASLKNTVVSSSVAYDGNEGLYVFAADEDNDLNTSTDQEIYSMAYDGTNWSSPVRLTENNVKDSNPKACFSNGNAFIVWDQDGKIVYAVDDFMTAPQPKVAVPKPKMQDAFSMAQGSNGTVAIVGSGPSDNNGHELYSATYDPVNDAWGEEMQLTSDNSLDRSPSAAFTENKLVTIYNRVKITNIVNTVDGQSYPSIGNTDLNMAVLDLKHDLAISADEITISENNPFPGSILTINAKVHNKGTFTESGAEVEFYYGDPLSGGHKIGQTQTIAGKVAPGDEASAGIQWEVAYGTLADSIYVVVDPGNNKNDADRSNNTASISILQPDLELSALECTPLGEGKYVAKVKVSNIGGTDITNAVIPFYYGDSSSEMRFINTINAGALIVGEELEVPFLWTPDASIFQGGKVNLFAMVDAPYGTTESTLKNNIRMVTVNKTNLDIVSYEPADKQENAGVSKAITITFNNTVLQGDDYGNITLTGPGGTQVSTIMVIKDETITITPGEPLQYETNYTLLMPIKGVKGTDGTEMAEDWSISFKTEGSSTYPLIQTLSDIPVDSMVALPFCRNIACGLNFNNIVCKDSQGQKVPCTFTCVNNLLNIKPDAALDYSSSYIITIPAGGLKDSNGNDIDPCSLNFTTQGNLTQLKSLTLSIGQLSPAFDPGVMNYTVNLKNAQTYIVVTAVPMNSASTVTINGDQLAVGQPKTVKLYTGSNTITIAVASEDGSTATTYKVVVNRAPSDDSSDSSEEDTKPAVTVPKVTEPTKTAAIEAGAYKENIQLSTNKGITTVSLNGSILNEAFTKVEADTDGMKTVSIRIPEVQGTNSYVLQVPAAVLASDNADRRIEMISGVGTITLPGNMLKGMEFGSAADVGISIGKADISHIPQYVRNMLGDRPVVELKLTAGDRTIAWDNPDVPVTVSIPYAPTAEELKDPEHITVWYMDGSGNVAAVPSGRYDRTTGKVTFNTTHFSKYAVAFVHKTFSDTNGYAWAKKQIEVLASKGIIPDTAGAAFNPSEI